MVSDNKVFKSWFLFVSSKTGMESSSHSMTHGLITMPTKAMSTGRSFRNKTDSSIQQQQVLMPPPVSKCSLASPKVFGETNIFNRTPWHFFRNTFALQPTILSFIEKFIQFGTDPRTQRYLYPKQLSSFPSWPTISQLKMAKQGACELTQVTVQ